MLGALSCGVDLAVERRGVEGGNSDVALVQRIEAVLIGVVGGVLALGAVLPQRLPALGGDAAGGGGGIDEGVEHRGVDVGVGGAADLVLTVPGVAAVHDVGPVLEVELLAVGAELVVAVEHQNVLDDEAVGRAGIGVLADLTCPGGSPVNELEVLVNAVDDLTPAGLVEAEEDVAVLVLIGGLDGGGITGDDGVIVNADGEAGVLGFLNEPGGALGGVGVGIDADGVAGVVLDLFLIIGRLGRVRSLLLAAGDKAEDHDGGKQER